MVIPIAVATHRRGSTFGRHKTTLNTDLLFERNRIALSYLTNVRYKYRIRLHVARILLSKIHRKEAFKKVIRARRDGVELSRILRKKYGLFINMYKAPILKITLREFVRYYIAGTKMKLLKHAEERIAKFIKELEVD